jgi:hypothetical protein
LLTEKVKANTWPARVSKILNNGLQHVKLEDFDYLLRVDSDNILPPNFVEENLKHNPDVCGLGGAMLLKLSSFRKVMDGKLDPYSDDSAVNFEFMRHGLRSTQYAVKPVTLRKAGVTHSLMYWVEQGYAYYQLGVEPFHLLAKLRLRWVHILSVFGYVYAFIQHAPKCCCAGYVRYHQLRRLIHPWKEKMVLRGYSD